MESSCLVGSIWLFSSLSKMFCCRRLTQCAKGGPYAVGENDHLTIVKSEASQNTAQHRTPVRLKMFSNHRFELVQEAHVVFEEKAYVGDVVQTHGLPFNAHAEGKPRIAFRVNAAVFQHLGVHHAASKNF